MFRYNQYNIPYYKLPKTMPMDKHPSNKGFKHNYLITNMQERHYSPLCEICQQGYSRHLESLVTFKNGGYNHLMVGSGYTQSLENANTLKELRLMRTQSFHEHEKKSLKEANWCDH